MIPYNLVFFYILYDSDGKPCKCLLILDKNGQQLALMSDIKQDNDKYTMVDLSEGILVNPNSSIRCSIVHNNRQFDQFVLVDNEMEIHFHYTNDPDRLIIVSVSEIQTNQESDFLSLLLSPYKISTIQRISGITTLNGQPFEIKVSRLA